MPVLAMDLGGTKLASAIFSEEGIILREEMILLEKNNGQEVGAMIARQVKKILDLPGEKISSIGIAVPGISYQANGTVWAPNIPGWEAYPLLSEIQNAAENVPVFIDSDRACCILGEQWQGVARECTDAIFLAVGTGIAAGILVNGALLRGADDIAGAIGWWALERPFSPDYTNGGCFESKASGEGIAKMAKALLSQKKDYKGMLTTKPIASITAYDVFHAWRENDEVAIHTIREAVAIWGMAIANLVSLFNPQKIIFGGGVFGPAAQFIPAICEEALKWGQPISMKKVIIETSALGTRAGLYGAGLLALRNRNKK